ncbi:Papilin [Clonorchis sinensis]|uniref:Papilin n=1 Tax=Clonorchis sinensis TaxID=79923 RepID=A0A8T1MXE7_CLOSI|nr:Papilin [Clonorchis sinensis]
MSRQIYYAKLVLCVSVITLTQSPPAVGQQRLPAKCTLPILSGYGTANYRKYGFNGQRCVPFTYAGAGGNANRFSTEAECRRECGGEAVTVATQTTLSTTPIPYTIDKCTLPIRSGFGTFNYERYGFDGRRCVPFTYTGAGGNANNFFSEAACRRECENKVVTQAKPTPTPVTPKSNRFVSPRCSLPLDQGRGFASIPMYGFDGSRCTAFTYGGFGGNANRFFKRQDCVRECEKG